MRILLLILHADPARGGAERYTLDLAADLAALGHAPTIAATSFGPAIAGVQFLEIKERGWSRTGRYRNFLKEARRLAESTEYDVVHAMLPVEVCDIYHPHAGIAAENLAKPLNQFNPRRKAFAEVERRLIENPSGPVVLCLSDYIRRAARRHYALADDRAPVLLNGIDLKRFKPMVGPRVLSPSSATVPELEEAADEGVGPTITALIIAQDFVRKGLPQSIKAVAKIADNRLRLVVVGKENPADYRELARLLSTDHRIHFAGPTDRAVDFYRAANFFVLPTRHDPCSLVVLEALAMGLPVISTKANGACEYMTDGVHGYVLEDPDDVDALAAAMRRMLDPEVRQAMRQACMALRPMLSQEEHLRKMLNIYERARNP